MHGKLAGAFVDFLAICIIWLGILVEAWETVTIDIDLDCDHDALAEKDRYGDANDYSVFTIVIIVL